MISRLSIACLCFRSQRVWSYTCAGQRTRTSEPDIPSPDTPEFAARLEQLRQADSRSLPSRSPLEMPMAHSMPCPPVRTVPHLLQAMTSRNILWGSAPAGFDQQYLASPPSSATAPRPACGPPSHTVPAHATQSLASFACNARTINGVQIAPESLSLTPGGRQQPPAACAVPEMDLPMPRWEDISKLELQQEAQWNLLDSAVDGHILLGQDSSQACADTTEEDKLYEVLPVRCFCLQLPLLHG